jgi:hypothetical protein
MLSMRRLLHNGKAISKMMMMMMMMLMLMLSCTAFFNTVCKEASPGKQCAMPIAHHGRQAVRHYQLYKGWAALRLLQAL